MRQTFTVARRNNLLFCKGMSMNLFIVGAGFTKAVFPCAPLNSELMAELKRNFSNSVSCRLQEQYATSDIEIALTKLDADIAMSWGEDERYRELVELRRAVENELGSYFSSYRASEELLSQFRWLTEFIDQAFAPGDVVVGLNYDCLLEGALDCKGNWSPQGGYGSSFGHLPVDEVFSTSPVTVLKIHGSANFGIAPYFNKPTASSVGFFFDEKWFPRSAKNTHFGYGAGTERPYLIAPSYVKLPTVEIAYLMLDALAAAATAEKLIVIGCALRPEDTFLGLIVTHFLRQSNWSARRIIVMDPKASGICERIRNYWGVDVSQQIVGIEANLESSVPELMKHIRPE